MIYVYEDYVHNKGVLLRRLVANFGPANVRLIDARDILAEILQTAPPDLLVMPGGADLYFCEKLNGGGNAAIHDYVAAGGAYLGICAGAYYGAAYVSFAESQPDWRITGARELAFIKATASGPIDAYLQDGDIAQAWHEAVRLTADNAYFRGEFVSYYEGGPLFTLYDEKVDILARYTKLADQAPAILHKQIGKGRVVLSGVHPEMRAQDLHSMSYRHKNPCRERDLAIAKRLEPYDKDQQQLLYNLIKISLGTFSMTDAA